MLGEVGNRKSEVGSDRREPRTDEGGRGRTADGGRRMCSGIQSLLLFWPANSKAHFLRCPIRAFYGRAAEAYLARGVEGPLRLQAILV